MSTFSPLLFRFNDLGGAPRLASTKGDLTTLLNECLIIKRLYTAASAESSFNDQSTAARIKDSTTFALFPGPTDDDRAYFSLSQKFNRIKFSLGTLGAGGAFTWEYWNGSTWTTLTVTDGTSGFTASGVVTFTIPGSWATTTVNGVLGYYVRVRATTAPGTNPLADYVTITGWNQVFVGTNQVDYQQGGGNLFYLDINDNGPITTPAAKEARARGWETLTALDTGINPFPRTGQGINNFIVIRKSSETDPSTVAHIWVLVADDRTFYLFSQEAPAASPEWTAFMFGDIFSVVPGDQYRTMIIGREIENTTGVSNNQLNFLATSNSASARAGHYMARAWSGLQTANGSRAVNKFGDAAKSSGAADLAGAMSFPNDPDGFIYFSPITVAGIWPTTLLLPVGRLRGLWQILHASTSVNDQDLVQGAAAGQLTGKSFLLLKQTDNTGGTGAGIFTLETSDTWETN